jgi:hypothetical protein
MRGRCQFESRMMANSDVGVVLAHGAYAAAISAITTAAGLKRRI